MRPVSGPWGGGNQWLVQLVSHLRTSGYEVIFDLRGEVDCIVVGNVRGISFGRDDIAEYRRRCPTVRCLHCIQDNDLHREDGNVDVALAEVDTVADFTVFVSDWLRAHHAERWFDSSRPHSVIHHAADPAIFHPVRSTPMTPGGTMRIVTHHWSAHRRKGFDVYAEVDRLIAAGELPDTELWMMGRWPKDIEWKAARTIPPRVGPEVASVLREAHVYLTASRFESCGMHVLEGAQCGLPVLYHVDGGGYVEIASRFGIALRDDIVGTIGDMREQYPDLRRRVLLEAPSGDAMCAQYRRVIQQLLARR